MLESHFSHPLCPPGHYPQENCRITARERSMVTCASKTPSKIDKNMLNLHFVREWHTFFWAQSQLKMKIRCFFQCFCLKIAQNLNFTQVFPRFFPQALLCGFSKLQLQTQATAQVGKSHSGRTGWPWVGEYLSLIHISEPTRPY